MIYSCCLIAVYCPGKVKGGWMSGWPRIASSWNVIRTCTQPCLVCWHSRSSSEALLARSIWANLGGVYFSRFWFLVCLMLNAWLDRTPLVYSEAGHWHECFCSLGPPLLALACQVLIGTSCAPTIAQSFRPMPPTFVRLAFVRPTSYPWVLEHFATFSFLCISHRHQPLPFWSIAGSLRTSSCEATWTSCCRSSFCSASRRADRETTGHWISPAWPCYTTTLKLRNGRDRRQSSRAKLGQCPSWDSVTSWGTMTPRDHHPRVVWNRYLPWLCRVEFTSEVFFLLNTCPFLL